jgi:hypothetical protein
MVYLVLVFGKREYLETRHRAVGGILSRCSILSLEEGVPRDRLI